MAACASRNAATSASRGSWRRVAQVGAADGIDRQAARHLAADVAAHAVGHHRQPAFDAENFVVVRLGVAVVIFVFAADQTGIGQVRQFNSGANDHEDSQALELQGNGAEPHHVVVVQFFAGDGLGWSCSDRCRCWNRDR